MRRKSKVSGISRGIFLGFFSKTIGRLSKGILFREFHFDGKISRGINSIFITLVPKNIGANYSRVPSYKPNVALYKIIAKVLSNKIREIDRNNMLLSKGDK